MAERIYLIQCKKCGKEQQTVVRVLVHKPISRTCLYCNQHFTFKMRESQRLR